MLFFLSSSFVALFLLLATLRAVQAHPGSVGVCFAAIEQDKWLVVAARTGVRVHTVLLFSPFSFFCSSIPSPCVALGSLGPSSCFFWHLLAWLPAFKGPHLRVGDVLHIWPLRLVEVVVVSERVQGGIATAAYSGWVWTMVGERKSCHGSG